MGAFPAVKRAQGGVGSANNIAANLSYARPKAFRDARRSSSVADTQCSRSWIWWVRQPDDRSRTRLAPSVWRSRSSGRGQQTFKGPRYDDLRAIVTDALRWEKYLSRRTTPAITG